MKKIIAILLCAVMLLGMLTACSKKKGSLSEEKIALSTEHYQVTVGMLSYYFHVEYQSFLSQNEGILNFYGLDPSKSLKEQYVSNPSGESTTWFDYFMDRTVQSVSNMLIYCEGAHELGIKLEDGDLESLANQPQITRTSAPRVATYEIKNSEDLAAIKSQVIVGGNSQGVVGSFSQGVAGGNSQVIIGGNSQGIISGITSTPSVTLIPSADSFGIPEGVSQESVRKAKELSALANKYLSGLSDKLSDEIKTSDITAAFDANPKKYLLVDYSYYNFETSYVEAKKDLKLSATADYALTYNQKTQIETKYEELVARVKKAVEDLKNAKTAKEANKVILTYAAEKEVKNAWAMQTINVGDNETIVKAAIVAQIVEEIMKGAEEGSALKDNAVLSSLGLEESIIGQLETVKNVAFTEALSDKKSSILEKVSYNNAETEISMWAFADTAKVGDFKEVKGSLNRDRADSGATFSITAYYLAKPAYRDTEKARSVAYMLFTDENAAKAATQAMFNHRTKTLSDFEALATQYATETHTHLEDYVKGSIGGDKFDTWLFAESTKVGTASPVLKLEDNATYCVALYYAEGHESWYVSVKKDLVSKRFDATLARLNKTVSITTNKDVINLIEA